MVYLDFKGIGVEATVEMKQHLYKDLKNDKRTRLEKKAIVTVRFWNLIIGNGDLTFIKSIFQFFMSSYWKRTSKEGSKIVFEKELFYDNRHEAPQSLHFTARQKGKEHFLQIILKDRGMSTNEIYLDGQEVIMLDIAIGKAISLLAPDEIDLTPPTY